MVLNRAIYLRSEARKPTIGFVAAVKPRGREARR